MGRDPGSDRMDKMFDELKNNIQKNTANLESSRDALEQQGHQDHPMGKRQADQQPTLELPHKAKRIKHDVEVTTLSMKAESLPQQRPQGLNMSLIDSAYAFADNISNAWDGPQTTREAMKAAAHMSGDEQFEEFELKDEYN